MNEVVWIISHGSSSKAWMDTIDKTIASLDYHLPIITSFINNIEKRTIEDGIEELTKLKAKKVIVVPLFVSSASTHIDDIKTILSKYKKKINFVFTSAMDDHQFVVEHIIKQASELSNNPSQEALLIIGHGTIQANLHNKWNRILSNLIDKLSQRTDYLQISHATVFPNTIIDQLNKIDKKLRVIVIPLFLSNGIYIDKKIPELIAGYNVIYSRKGYLSGNWITSWIIDQVEATFLNNEVKINEEE
ncbi:hypothetical protein BHF71_09435 [Vulcanibacillus modesticaldus]|uniref:Cobalamin biosynthesis protein CbiX n=1 Tax=Vulcanibacillus modesticaldus TaxID=337097 RepID=A0A1D2YU64_9BACI|nr:CbiX/SirB N-terminal domain-containing protein [Vulcanibacillus modesticaldus]OEF99248.1 hypothetical protein BHF71_09435 [Vulcanibacillus modesticaldus]